MESEEITLFDERDGVPDDRGLGRLECPVCYKSTRTLVTFDCLHDMCSTCTRRWTRNSCPMCRRSVHTETFCERRFDYLQEEKRRFQNLGRGYQVCLRTVVFRSESGVHVLVKEKIR